MYCSIKFTFGHYFAYLSNFFTSFFALSVHRNVFCLFLISDDVTCRAARDVRCGGVCCGYEARGL